MTIGARPKCKHGNPVGNIPCRECDKERAAASEATKPLEALFWEHRARNTGQLHHLLIRAYRMGVEAAAKQEGGGA